MPIKSGNGITFARIGLLRDITRRFNATVSPMFRTRSAHTARVTVGNAYHYGCRRYRVDLAQQVLRARSGTVQSRLANGMLNPEELT
jgi:hypothetical protein